MLPAEFVFFFLSSCDDLLNTYYIEPMLKEMSNNIIFYPLGVDGVSGFIIKHILISDV